MTILITKLTDREIPEHWRVIIVDNDVEIMHTSASSKMDSLLMVSKELLAQAASIKIIFKDKVNKPINTDNLENPLGIE